MGTSSSSTAVVIGGGRIVAPDRDFDLVIAADSGLDAALAAHLVPTVLVGDLDSISASGAQWAEDHGVDVERHPADKEHTDTALALRRAAESGCEHLTLLGPAVEARLDHLLGAIIGLGDGGLAGIGTITALFGTTTVHVVHPGHRITFTRPSGGVFSLLGLHGACAGVTVAGARWPLHGDDLAAGSTRGISNESVGEPIEVSVASGVLTVVVPEVLS